MHLSRLLGRRAASNRKQLRQMPVLNESPLQRRSLLRDRGLDLMLHGAAPDSLFLSDGNLMLARRLAPTYQLSP